MLWRIRRAAVLFGILPVIAAANTGIIQVTGIRSWSHAGSTRIILETTGPFQYRTDRAQNPDRFFIDILNAQPWIGKKRLASHEIGDRLAKRVRIAETAPSTTRVVFDLTADVDFKITTLATPDRMVIELRPVHSALVHRFVYPPTTLATPVRQVMIPVPPTLFASSMIPVLGRFVPSLPGAVVSKPRPPVRPAVASTDATRSLTRALGLKVNRIVIDAGHGGHDDGTIGPHGILEKDIVLDVSLRLAKLVQERLGADVVLTRSDDTFIPLTERTSLANDHRADLFLSIHANSSPAPEVAGTESFYLNFSSSPGAIDVAARENAGSDKSVGELKDLIQSITLNDKIEESHTFALAVQSSLTAQAVRTNVNSRNRGVKRAPFVVLIGASMPSILAEIGFLSNARDESNLNKPEYRQKIAEALYKGVAQYSQSLSHFEIAQERKPGRLTTGVSQ